MLHDAMSKRALNQFCRSLGRKLVQSRLRHVTEFSDNGRSWYDFNSVPRKSFSKLEIAIGQKRTDLRVLRGFDNLWMEVNDSPGDVSSWQCVRNPTSLFVDVATCPGEYVDTLLEVEFSKTPIRLRDSFYVKQRQILRFRFTFENTEGYDNVRISLADLLSIRIRNIGKTDLCLAKFLLQVDHLAIDLVDESVLLISAGNSFSVPFQLTQRLLNVSPSSCCRNATNESDNDNYSSYRSIRQQHLQAARSLVNLRKLPNYIFGTTPAVSETCQTCYGSSICDFQKKTCVCGTTGNNYIKGTCTPKKTCKCPVGSYCSSQSRNCTVVCKEGFSLNGDFRCENIDECSLSPPVCAGNFLCVDSIGSYECLPPVLNHNGITERLNTVTVEELKINEEISVRKCKTGFQAVADLNYGSFDCEDIDECQDSNRRCKI